MVDFSARTASDGLVTIIRGEMDDDREQDCVVVATPDFSSCISSLGVNEPLCWV